MPLHRRHHAGRMGVRHLMPLPSSLSRISAVTGANAASWARSVPLWVSAALVVLLAWQAVQLTWAVLGVRRVPSTAPAVAPGPAAGPAGPAIDIPAIVNAHLFGVAGASGPGEADPTAVATTQMNLVLVGTIAEADPQKGYAIVGDSPATARVYSVGKTITGGTKLHSVYPDRVILDRGGKLEALLLPKKFTGGGMSASRPPPPPDANLGQRLQDLAAQNPAAITEIIRPQPVFANGQQRGYRVYPGRNRQQFSRLGLMPGDLVTAINGTPLDDPARGMEILQSMNSATEVTVTIERNGQPTQISINNAQVAAEAAAAAAAPEAIPVSEVPETSPQDPAE
jgi:general secretion pathway protein C